jgi:hypothetical protein
MGTKVPTWRCHSPAGRHRRRDSAIDLPVSGAKLLTHIPHVSRETGYFLKLTCCNGFRKRCFSRLNLRLNYSTLLRKEFVPMTETIIASLEIRCTTF